MKEPPHQVRNMLLDLKKYLKPKKYQKKGQKAALKPVVNKNATKHAVFADERATTSGEEHVASPQKVSKAKEIPKKGQKAEPSTGYICGFEVYTGDASGQSQGNVQEVQDASKTSCTVLGLLDSVQLLDMGHHVYFDNYYNSPDLIDLLYKRKMHACGTVKKNQKSLPLAVTQAKLKQGETVFCHKNNLLALKWIARGKCTFSVACTRQLM